jgi:tight adherence protein C
MILLFLLGLLSLAVCVSALIGVMNVRRVRAARQVAEIDSYGSSSDAALRVPTLGGDVPASGVSDVAARIGGLVAQRVGRVRESDLRAELMSAGLYAMTPRTLLGYRVIAATVPSLLIISLGSGSAISILLALVLVPFGWLLPLTLVRRRARMRIDEIDRSLPDLVDLLVVTVEAGLSFSASLRVAADQFDGPLSDELHLTLQEQTMGLAMSDALQHLLQRADTSSMRSFVRSVIQGETLGVSTGTIMRNIAVDMRKRRRKSAEERAHKAPVKLLFPLVFLIFPSIFIVLLLPGIFVLENSLS